MADTKKKTKLTTNEVKKENTTKKTSKKVEEPSLKVKYGEKTPKTKETKIPKSKTQTKAVRKSKNAQDPNLDRDKKILKESGNLELKEDFVKNSTRTDLSNKPDIATHSLANYGTSVTRGRFKRKHIEKTSTERHLPEHGPIDEKTGKEILLSLKNVKITFGKGAKAVEAVKNATFDIFKGETFSLVGESGSGKTTIGRAVIRVNPLADGEISFKGVRISGNIPHSLDREVIRNIQMVFQDPAASLNERATVEYIVSEGLYNFHLYKNDAERVMKVENMIKEVGLLPEHLTRYPHEFSGGQRQRIGIARAMVMEPELIVADEPISALDVSIRAQILNLLKKFQKEQGLTCLFIAHDLSIVRFISDRIGVIYKGDIVEIADGEELFNFPLHPYTKSLISAIPLPDPKIEKEKVLFTYDPSVHDYSEDKPELVDIGHNHFVYGNKAEIAKYKALRNKNVPLEVIKTSKDPKKHEKEIISMAAADEFLAKPVHDTGSNWYRLLSFILPIIGLPLAFIFKGHKYYRNYKACLKWSIISFIIIGIIIAIYLILLAFTLV